MQVIEVVEDHQLEEEEEEKEKEEDEEEDLHHGSGFEYHVSVVTCHV
jgi:hypothetical protein